MNEAYQFLEFEQIYASTFGNGFQSVAITASNPGEGCTSLAMALARRHTAVGRRALLVDMNIYRPHFSSRFQLPSVAWQPGASPLPVPQRIDHNIAVITAPVMPGISFREPATLRGMIEQWQQEYDAVIIDTSPLNALNYANIPAENVCASADACILLVMANQTREEHLLQAREKLLRMKANLVGVVVNDYHNPSLADEMIREVDRLTHRLPRLNAYIKQRIATIGLLSGTSW